jgi:hypothetical protein
VSQVTGKVTGVAPPAFPVFLQASGGVSDNDERWLSAESRCWFWQNERAMETGVELGYGCYLGNALVREARCAFLG